MDPQNGQRKTSGTVGWIWLSAIFVVAIGLRIAFAASVRHQLDDDHIIALNADQKEYLQLADNIATTGQYTDKFIRSHNRGLVRTPGYPTFLAIIKKLGGGFGAIFYTQAVIGSFIPVLVTLLAMRVLQNRALAIVAGFIAALSAPGIASSGIILVDLLFATLFVAGFTAMWFGIARGRIILCAIAGVAFAAAALVKPTLLLWPVALPVVFWCITRANAQKLRLASMALIILLPASSMLAWCYRNYRVENIFILSSVSARNLRCMVAPVVEEWAKRGRYPSKKEVDRNYQRLGELHLAYLHSSGRSAAGLYRLQQTSAMEIFRANPGKTLSVYLIFVRQQFIEPWNSLKEQLPKGGILRSFVRAMDRAGSSKPFGFIWPILGTITILSAAIARPRVSAEHRGDIFAALALWITYAYFVLLAGTTTGQGSRILYPVEFAKVLLVLLLVVQIGSLIRLAQDRARNDRLDQPDEPEAPTPAMALASDAKR
jgi:hypothetical protein